MKFSDLEQFDNSPHTSGLWQRYACPLCGDSKPQDREHQCLGVKGSYFHCFRCGASGQFEDLKVTKVTKVATKPKWMQHFE